MIDAISDTPPADETERAIWAIRRLVKSTTGKTLSLEQATSLFDKARDRLEVAMAEVTPK